jgi:hypothetical protein
VLEVIGFIAGSYREENWIHKKFVHYRAHGEWFRPEDELVSFIKYSIANGIPLIPTIWMTRKMFTQSFFV